MNSYYAIIFICTTLQYTVLSQTTKSSKDAQHNSHSVSTKIPSADYISTPDTWDSNPDLKSLWVYQPAPIQSNPVHLPRIAFFKQPHLVTRLTKPLTFGFDPSFNKEYFEPFETRRKPVTLVAFRKNGQIPRGTIRDHQTYPSSEIAEVAEMQSSFNEISSFWDDIPDLYNV